MVTVARAHSAGELWTGPLEYALPPELIAQSPATVRSDARLMVLERATGGISHRRFRDLPALVSAGDLLVANDSAVFRARLAGRKPTGGAAEILLLSAQPVVPGGVVPAMVRTSKSVKAGQRLKLADGSACVIEKSLGAGRFNVSFPGREPGEVAADLGEVPLPPYIERPAGTSTLDMERYQTVYAREEGSVAAPTAGLHFTPELLAELGRASVGFECISLHVGPGTFTPLRGDVESHRMEAERCTVGAEVSRAIAGARKIGARVVAVGTTTVRALESAAAERAMADGSPEPWEGATSLFIRPGHQFQAVDALITNFHLPASTLLCLVMAFTGEALVREAYECAVRDRYRFYSYGDAMLVL
ncbi:MAG: tRNA preQ1(34) S-adenosylmethionine ribosyltransferase-isomerase QueA [Myxococcales bacterium]|jgi:S-adenosylmethionine:tRNA ribosyltransferase-isomerase|nr:MAG: tRNA preQ1(34) S-adenosylmethionine ribosyltransferase-isomerase QueA [Myxococcales bacterium]